MSLLICSRSLADREGRADDAVFQQMFWGGLIVNPFLICCVLVPGGSEIVAAGFPDVIVNLFGFGCPSMLLQICSQWSYWSQFARTQTVVAMVVCDRAGLLFWCRRVPAMTLPSCVAIWACTALGCSSRCGRSRWLVSLFLSMTGPCAVIVNLFASGARPCYC